MTLKYFFYSLLVFTFSIVLHSCVITKNWGKKHLLIKNDIKGNKEVYSENLYPYIRQKPNRKILGIYPYLWVYQFGSRFIDSVKIKKDIERIEEEYKREIFDSTKSNKYLRNPVKYLRKLKRRTEKKLKRLDTKLEKGNWLMRIVGEKPSLYDSTETRKAVESMEKYLANKGYFQANVLATTDTASGRQRIKVTYNIAENFPTKVKSLEFVSTNNQIDSLLNANKKSSAIKTDKNYDANSISTERIRVEKFLKDRGYYTFNRQYVNFEVDTTKIVTDILGLEDIQIDIKKEAEIRVVINNPTHGEHKVYTIDSVFFYMPEIKIDSTKRKKLRKHIKKQKRHEADLKANKKQIVINDSLKKFKNKTYYYSRDSIIYVLKNKKRPRYSDKILDTRVKLKPNEKYSAFNQGATQRGLASLNMFKFVSIRYDTTGKFNAHINVSPLERYQWTSEIGVNVNQGLPGPFIDFSLKNRNTFGGAEIFENSFRFSIDGQTGFSDNTKLYSNQEIGLTSSLVFPQILFPTGLRFRFNKFNPNTKLATSFNFVKRPEYTRTNLRASIAYNGTGIRGYSNINVTLSELSYVRNPRLSEAFQTQLTDLQKKGNPLFRSFQSGLVSSLYFIYTYNNNIGNQNTKSFYFRVLAESGGTLGFLIPKIPDEKGEFLGVTYFQFFRVNPSFHFYLPLGRKEHQLAFRLNTGVSKPIGKSESLPYEKFFFAGGSNSVRAWRPRRLGPGSFSPTKNEDGSFDDRFEQPGEIILETNLEYRFPIYSFIKGALFVDVGNVWTFKEDKQRLGGNFDVKKFYKELAVGTGLGFRFNLPFLLLRFDLGLKTYDPARENKKKFVLKEFKPLKPFAKDLMLLNIGIGYPF